MDSNTETEVGTEMEAETNPEAAEHEPIDALQMMPLSTVSIHQRTVTHMVHVIIRPQNATRKLPATEPLLLWQTGWGAQTHSANKLQLNGGVRPC